VKRTSDFRTSLQNSWWLPKTIVWILLIVIAFLIPNSFFKYYEYFALVGAGIFILQQLLLLVDFAYSWSESWVRKYEDTQNMLWYYALLICCIFLYLLTLSGIIAMFIFFL